MIRIEGLTKVYPSFTLQNVSFRVGAGRTILSYCRACRNFEKVDL